MDVIRLPRLLDQRLNEVTRLHPVRLSATDNIDPTSTATMTIPFKDEARVAVRDFVEIYDADGSKGIYRVEGVSSASGRTKTVNLTHGIVTLEDYILPSDMNLEGNIRTMLQEVLDKQIAPMWTLGGVDVPDDETYSLSVGGSIALQAVIDIVDLVPAYALVFDQTTVPWTLHLRRKDGEPSCECRLSRNMNHVDVSFTTQDMCTRVTSDLLPDGYMDADNVDEVGVIVRELSTEDDMTEDEAVELAEQYLEQHKNPIVSIEIEAIDLAEATGEPFDALTLGKLCRVALPDWGVHYVHQIVSVYWDDLLHNPLRKKLTLSTMQEKSGTAIARATSTANSASNLARQNYKHITETENAVMIQAERIELMGEEISLRATKAEVEGAVLRISNVEIDLDATKALIDLKADRTEYDELSERVTSAEIAIDGANAAIALKASQTTVDDLGERVSAAEIAIDGANSAIALKADKIDLQGYVTMEEFAAFEGSISDLWADELRTTYVSADNVIAGYGDFDDLVFGSINGMSSDEWVTGIVSDAGYATQSWVQSTYMSAATITSAYPTTRYVAENYMLKSGLTTATATVCTGINKTTATTPPFYNANGTQVSSGVSYVSNVTYNTTELTYLVYA